MLVRRLGFRVRFWLFRPGAAERVFPTAFLAAAVLFAIRTVFRVAAVCSEVAVRVSREDSWADSRVLAAYYRAVSKHLDSDGQA